MRRFTIVATIITRWNPILYKERLTEPWGLLDWNVLLSLHVALGKGVGDAYICEFERDHGSIMFKILLGRTGDVFVLHKNSRWSCFKCYI